MKRFFVIIIMFMTAFILLAAATETRAETAKKYNLAVGGYFGIGGATNFYDGRDGGFAMGLQPEVQFFVIDNLSITYRFLWERIMYDHRWTDGFGNHHVEEAPMDIAPFLLGARYYFSIIDKLKAYAGMGLGFTAYRIEFEDGGWFSRIAFAMDFYGGVEYEVADQLTVGGMFNIMLPNLGPLNSYENVIGRFMFFFGVNYYIPLKV
jgi:opacity protein-like surface antigen